MTNQVVILCGGRGTRLKPLTNTVPKPMAPVNNIPFLQYLIIQARDQGFKEFLLLTGYLSNSIETFFQDGEKLGVRIEYSVGAPDLETGERLWHAKEKLHKSFVLMYSDNFVQCNIHDVIAKRELTQTTLSMVAQPKKPGNISIGEDDIVSVYDNTRSDSTPWVEVGYMSVDRDPFLDQLLPDQSLTATLQKLSNSCQISAHKGIGFYHSISDINRLALTEKFLSHKKIILIDRDGTINIRPPRGSYVTTWKDFHFIPTSVKAMKELSDQGFSFIVISNQAGIGRGIVSLEKVKLINQNMVNELSSKGIKILDVFLCPHHWEDNCACRKPLPGMFFAASAQYQFRVDKTFYLGDDIRDIQAANNAGCKSVLLSSGESNPKSYTPQPTFVCSSLDDSVSFLIDYYQNIFIKSDLK